MSNEVKTVIKFSAIYCVTYWIVLMALEGVHYVWSNRSELKAKLKKETEKRKYTKVKEWKEVTEED